jgi:hypothetical protein
MPSLPRRASGYARQRVARVTCTLLLLPVTAVAQPIGPTTTASGTLVQMWGDPRPGEPGGPREQIVILSADGQRTTEVVIPPSVADAHGGLQALLGRTVTTTLAARDALAAPRGSVAPPAVTAIAVAAELATVAQPYAPNAGAQRWIAIPCRYADNPASPVTPAYLQGLLGDGPATLGEYWREASYGKVTLTGLALEWRNLPKPHAAYVSDVTGDGVADVNLALLSTDCLDAADAEVDFGDVAGVLLIFNGPVGCCAWGGPSA